MTNKTPGQSGKKSLPGQAQLSTEELEKGIRVARIVAQATATFGSVERATRWLGDRQERFGDRTALDMAASERGAKLVEAALIQLDEGYF